MKLLFYLGHPAHFHLFKNVITHLKDKNEIKIVIKKKDVLEKLLDHQGWDAINILPKGRKDNLLSIGFGQIFKDISLYKVTGKFRPDLMIGTSVEIAHIGKLRKIPSIIVNEDDYDVVPLFSILSYPFSSYIITPSICRVGRWQSKTIQYNGYHELAYLYPKYFQPDRNIVAKLFKNTSHYFIIRFARLGAHHDFGKKGISRIIAERIIEYLIKYGKIYITSERKLDNEFERYRINIDPYYIHHALYFADMVIGDSQTMTAEAAVLGIPSIRVNDFVGKLSYLEEMEHKYGLTFGFKPDQANEMFFKIKELLDISGLKDEWRKKRDIMLADKIDVTVFFVWLIENFPESIKVLKENPDYQYHFK